MVTRHFGVESFSDLDTDERLEILGIIDKLRQLGPRRYSAPAVGRSRRSIKWQIIEGLTGLSFPIASELCTRYATQIILRRTPITEAVARISILPGREASNEGGRQDNLLQFSKEIPVNDLSDLRFTEILDGAAVAMGLPSSQEADVESLPKRFSDDVLRIELSGPDHHHLSIVDVPGLFHNATKFQTEEDRQVIRSFLEMYMQDKRTIILAVMDARDNLANQEVFAMAREADPMGKRTLGIITKCEWLDREPHRSVAQQISTVLLARWKPTYLHRPLRTPLCHANF
ncbi:Dynamin-like protein 1 [Elsinoe fawcettii]|nr:Dynamin-like protein 1 [Elsinoe fawcettii]